MMGRQSGQLSMMVMDLSELIPNNHLLRRISQVISFDFIYEILEPYYPSNGRPSTDPVSMFKMLLVGYLYGIKSERRLVQEIQLNIAYRWFCGFELADKIPDHSTFSKTRLRKWNESQLFQQVFLEIVRRCVKSGLVDGKELAADGTYLPANVSRDSWIETEVEAELSMQSYLDRLDEELSKQPGFKKPSIKTIKKRRTTSKTDPDSGCINHGKKSGIGYLMETTVDCKCGIITGVDVYPANEKESLLVLRHLERQIQNGVPMQNIALDRGYDTGAVHRGLELLGITGYIPAIQFSNSPEKYGFVYLPQEDAFCCPEGARLVYQRLNCSQTTGKYLRCYQVQGETCKHCKRKSVCFKQTGIRRRILGSSCYPAFYRGHERIGSDAYWHMMRLRKIWAEGSFSVLKREHCLSKIRKRGILAVTEECLLSAMALNLKRMVKAILLFLYKPRMWVENIVFCPIFHFCQQVLGSTALILVLNKILKQQIENLLASISSPKKLLSDITGTIEDVSSSIWSFVERPITWCYSHELLSEMVQYFRDQAIEHYEEMNEDKETADRYQKWKENLGRSLEKDTEVEEFMLFESDFLDDDYGADSDNELERRSVTDSKDSGTLNDSIDEFEFAEEVGEQYAFSNWKYDQRVKRIEEISLSQNNPKQLLLKLAELPLLPPKAVVEVSEKWWECIHEYVRRSGNVIEIKRAYADYLKQQMALAKRKE